MRRGPVTDEMREQAQRNMEIYRRIQNIVENLEAMRGAGIFEQVLPLDDEGNVQVDKLDEALDDVPGSPEGAESGLQTYHILYQTLQAFDEMEENAVEGDGRE